MVGSDPAIITGSGVEKIKAGVSVGKIRAGVPGLPPEVLKMGSEAVSMPTAHARLDNESANKKANINLNPAFCRQARILF